MTDKLWHYIVEYEYLSEWGMEDGIFECHAINRGYAKDIFEKHIESLDDETYDHVIIGIFREADNGA